MNKEQFTDLCSLYFLNALDEEELKEFKVALEGGDPDFQKIYSDFQKTALHLPLAVEQVDPPESIKTKIMNSVKSAVYEEKVSLFEKFISIIGFRNPKFAFVLSTALIIVIASLGYYIYQNGKVINYQQNMIVKLQGKVQKDEAILNVLSAKKVDFVVMNGLEVNPSGYGKMIIDPGKRTAILQVSNLPATSKDKDYQLWVIKNNKPVSNGVFAIKNKNGKNYFMVTNIAVESLNHVNAFAITLEPKGGVPQPTGKMFLAGKVSL